MSTPSFLLPTTHTTVPGSFGPACVFAFTIVTTIGFGTNRPATTGGQIFLVLYALVGIPLTASCLLIMAERALRNITWLFTLGSDRIQAAFDAFDDDNSGELDLDEFKLAIQQLGINITERQFERLVNEIDEDGNGSIDRDEFTVAITKLDVDITEAAGRKNRFKIVAIALVAWLGVCTLAFALTESWSAWEALYFAVVTITTIGLGDYYPQTSGGMVTTVLFSLLGLGMLAVMFALIEGMLDDLEQARAEAAETAARKRNVVVALRKRKEAEEQQAVHFRRAAGDRVGASPRAISAASPSLSSRRLAAPAHASNGGVQSWSSTPSVPMRAIGGGSHICPQLRHGGLTSRSNDFTGKTTRQEVNVDLMTTTELEAELNVHIESQGSFRKQFSGTTTAVV